VATQSGHLATAATDAASSLLNVSDLLIRLVAHPCLRCSRGQLARFAKPQTAQVGRLASMDNTWSLYIFSDYMNIFGRMEQFLFNDR
jgi:hypothetical protein